MVSLKFSLICDEVRREDNGKLLIIGLYLPDIVVPQLPFVLSSLTLFLSLESDTSGHAGFHLRLQRLETGQNLVETRGGMVFQRPGQAVSHLKFANVQFVAAGAYNFILDVDGQPDPIIIGFNVILNVPEQRSLQNPPMPR